LKPQLVSASPSSEDPIFEGIGAVNGGGATSVLFKDYPEPQRSQILDLVFRPQFGASVSTMMVEIPGDGNSTQGSMPSHMHEHDDLDGFRGYTWWIMREAKRRNPNLTLDAAAWSAPGWLGGGEFWSEDTAEYYVQWIKLLRDHHGLKLDAIGCRNEKGVNLDFAKKLRRALTMNGFGDIRIHAFDNWPTDKFDFVFDLNADSEARDAIDIIGAHVMHGDSEAPAPKEVQAWAKANQKLIWNTEDHVYRDGFSCLIGIVRCFNRNFIVSGATKVVLWYDIAGVYPIEPYPTQPAMIIAREPWSGHYEIREALWGYAHYGQFSDIGWLYIRSGCKLLTKGGSIVTLSSPDRQDFSIIIETENALSTQILQISLNPLPSGTELCVWESNEDEQFFRRDNVTVVNGLFEFHIAPNRVYSLSTTMNQCKGSFDDVPGSRIFPFPYYDDFETNTPHTQFGRLPRFMADISGAFELTPTATGTSLQQKVPIPTISWAPDWKPYTIFGDATWQDCEIHTRVRIQAGESVALMGRVHHVGTGYGFIPKCYYFEFCSDGTTRIVSVDGKIDKSEIIGDAEQQAIIRASNDISPGGETTLLQTETNINLCDEWVDASFRLSGANLVGIINGRKVIEINDNRHPQGMAGLLAGSGATLSKPEYAFISVTEPGGIPTSEESFRASPLYPET